jgi:hypothetical protein
MGFSTKQMRALRRNLGSAHIRTRLSHGRELSYVEAWHAIAEANRIFGHDGWDRETVESRCVLGREIRGTFHAVYVAKVRLTVHANGRSVVREGHGTGEGHGSSPGETHDIGLKAAETDGTKRALATFGKPFGLTLYLGDRRGSPDPKSGTDRRPPVAPRDRPANSPRAQVSESTADAIGNGRDGAIASNGHLVAKHPTPPECGPDPLKFSGGKETTLPLGFPKRHRDRAHLKYVTTQPCLMCGRRPSDAHHLTFAQPRGLGLKVSDEFTVPLCRLHHRAVHQSGSEAAWWEDLEIDVVEIAKGLWEQSLAKGRGEPAEPTKVGS